MRFTRQKLNPATTLTNLQKDEKQPVLTYAMHYRDKGLLRVSGAVELGLTLSRTFDNARYDVDVTLSDVEFRGTVQAFCDDVDRFVATGKGLRTTLRLELADFQTNGSGTAAARALRAILRRIGTVELEL